MENFLEQLAPAWHKGTPRGIYSVCSAHPWILEAAVDQALADGSHLLIEATSNQVNHRGGYTGMQPKDFSRLVFGIAGKKGLDPARILLGGDHLGPNPWQGLSADQGMEEAQSMVEAYVRAGFHKIHLDASMACAGDPHPLNGEQIARRAAQLCAAAEQAAAGRKPVYVVGTEVPTPGGALESLDTLQVTSRAAAEDTIATHKRVFEEQGLGLVWPRVIALVVQPGVEFNHDRVVDYEPLRAQHLSALLKEHNGLVYEAHSTDYQRPEAYHCLVRDGFAILKVGPALTFAMRECLSNLSKVESELVPSCRRSRLMEVLEEVMERDRRYWEQHYVGDGESVHLQRIYSYSDRIRYYWSVPQVQNAVQTLLENLGSVRIPETLISNFLPERYEALREGKIEASAHAMILDSVRQILRRYAGAC